MVPMHLIALILTLHWPASPEWAADQEVADRLPCCGHHLCDSGGLLQWLQQNQETLQSGRMGAEPTDFGWVTCGRNVKLSQAVGELWALWLSSCIYNTETANMIWWHVGRGVCRRWPARPSAGWWWSTLKQWCRKESPLKMLMRGGKEQRGWSKRLISSNSSSENWLLWVHI